MNRLFAEVDITLNIQNNTAYPQKINVLGNNANLLDTANATTEYRWNMTAFSFGTEDSVSVMYRSTATPVYKVFIAGLANQSLQAIVDSLNTLGIGYFNLYVESGQTYIGTYNQNYVFANLNVFDSSVPQLQYSWATQGSGGTNDITLNPPAAPSVSDANPVTSVGDVTVVLGDIFTLSGTTSNFGKTTVNILEVKTNTQFALDVLGGSQAFNYGSSISGLAPYWLLQVYEE